MQVLPSGTGLRRCVYPQLKLRSPYETVTSPFALTVTWLLPLMTMLLPPPGVVRWNVTESIMVVCSFTRLDLNEV